MWVYIFSQNLYSALVWNIHSLHSCWILDILLFFSEVLIILGVSEVVCLGSSQDWATPEHSQGCPSTTLCCSGHVTTGLSPVWGPECSGWGFHQVPLMETFSLALMRPQKLLLLLCLFSLLWSDWRTLAVLLHLPPSLLHLKQLQDELTHTAECKDSFMDSIH